MATSEENQKIKQEIRTAIKNGDGIGLLKAGHDAFWNMLFSRKTMTFQQFIEASSDCHDKFILDVCRQEHLTYVGGKMLIELDQSKAVEVPIWLSAEFYFQTPNQEWIVKEKKGQTDNRSFSDWDTNEMVANLRKTGKLEFLIEPPA